MRFRFTVVWVWDCAALFIIFIVKFPLFAAPLYLCHAAPAGARARRADRLESYEAIGLKHNTATYAERIL